MISTIKTPNGITIVITSTDNSKVYTLNTDHTNYNRILEAINVNDENSIHKLMDVKTQVAKYSEGNITVEGGTVIYKGREINGVIVDRILSFINENLPVQPLLKFLNKLMRNPSSNAITELYTFLEKKNLPITPDGNFLAYKGVDVEYYSLHSGNITLLKGEARNGHIKNTVGSHIKVPRNEVCDDLTVGCAQGLHAGALEYATNYSKTVVVVEIDPSNVVSVPKDSYFQKLRICEYKVVGKYVSPLDSNYCDAYTEKKTPNTDVEDHTDSFCPICGFLNCWECA